MANDSVRYDEKSFDDLSLFRLEFILPDISSPRLLEEFVINHNFSDQFELESHPTAILDDSCVSEVMSKPSIQPEDSVEAFAFAHIGSLFYSSIQCHMDTSAKNREVHGFVTPEGANAECETFLLEEQNCVSHSPASFHP